MPAFEVYYLKFLSSPTLDAQPNAVNLENYVHMGSVKANDLDHLFSILQVTDIPGAQHPFSERCLALNIHTSMYVGDVVMDSAGVYYRCAFQGWDKVVASSAPSKA